MTPEQEEIARITGWHLGTARPAIMPPPKGTELAGYWYDKDGKQVAAAFTDPLMGVQAYTLEQAKERREMYNSIPDTLEHIRKVQKRLEEVMRHLEQRATDHDASKLEEPEKSVFDKMTPVLRTLTYGSDEYKAALVEMGEGLRHHYAHNAHHPEHWTNGINDMSLLDILEMLCDWRAATDRVNNGSMEQSLPINRDRFGINLQLYTILENTVRELGW